MDLGNRIIPIIKINPLKNLRSLVLQAGRKPRLHHHRQTAPLGMRFGQLDGAGKAGKTIAHNFVPMLEDMGFGKPPSFMNRSENGMKKASDRFGTDFFSIIWHDIGFT